MLAYQSLEQTKEDEWKKRFDIDGFINYGKILEIHELENISKEIDLLCDDHTRIPENLIKYHKDLKYGG